MRPTLAVVYQANTIIAEYLTEDFKLTLRQLFIHRPKKELSHEKNLKSVANTESEDTTGAGAVDTASSTPAVEGEGAGPFDLERLALSQSFAETIGVKKLLTHVPVGKPGEIKIGLKSTGPELPPEFW